MGYLKIKNLYADKTVLSFKEVYAMEKIHGTSAHLAWDGKEVTYFPGGEPMDRFMKIWDTDAVTAAFKEYDQPNVIVYGEAYGGKCQGMSETYGKDLKFVAFDVKLGGKWLEVPAAQNVCKQLGLEFVSYSRVPATLAELDKERDKASDQSSRNGIDPPGAREGIVIRPLIECYTWEGRVIAKHKGDAFRETETVRRAERNGAKDRVLLKANEAAREYVTEMRLKHILGKRQPPHLIEHTGEIAKAMVQDVLEEADDVNDTKAFRKAVSGRTCKIYKEFIQREGE
jgi:hypothetical protein